MLQKEVISALVADRCRENADLAERMQSDSKSTMDELCGVVLPADMDVRTVQNTSGLVHVPLPAYKDLPDATTSNVITDEDLAALSGGEVIFSAIVIGSIVVSAVVVTLGVSVGLIAAAATGKFDGPAPNPAGGVQAGGNAI